MGTDNRTPEPAPDLSEAASRNTLALNPLVGIRGQDLVDSAGILFKAVINEPKVATEQWLSFVSEMGSILAGKSERAPKPGDRRFADPAWKESSLHSGLLKAYLAWGETVSGLVDKTSLSDIDKQRAHLITGYPDRRGWRPTNTMFTNPGGGTQIPRHRRAKPVERAEELFRRSGAQSRHAVDGGYDRVQGRRESGDDAGRGDLPQRAARADPVHPDDADGQEAAARDHAAADQQVLRARSRRRTRA